MIQVTADDVANVKPQNRTSNSYLKMMQSNGIGLLELADWAIRKKAITLLHNRDFKCA
jgi:hypothetical protein